MLPTEESKAEHIEDTKEKHLREREACEKTAVTTNGGNCSNGIRVKVVAEINEEGSSINVACDTIPINNTRKRLASIEEASSSKRYKSPEKDGVDLPESSKHNDITENNGKELPESSDDRVGSSADRDVTESNLKKDRSDANVPEDDTTPSARLPIKREPVTQSDTEENDDTNEVRPSCSGVNNPVDIKPAVKIEIETADSSTTTRISCRFGIRCYRRNPMHRQEEAHPGDDDYKRPTFPPPPDGTPDCPYGDKCYRRNPVHFQQFNHPPDTDFAGNYKNYSMRLRQRRMQQIMGDNETISSNSDDEYDLEDPFIDDAELDSDYVPSDDENEEDYDECDRAEE